MFVCRRYRVNDAKPAPSPNAHARPRRGRLLTHRSTVHRGAGCERTTTAHRHAACTLHVHAHCRGGFARFGGETTADPIRLLPAIPCRRRKTRPTSVARASGNGMGGFLVRRCRAPRQPIACGQPPPIVMRGNPPLHRASIRRGGFARFGGETTADRIRLLPAIPCRRRQTRPASVARVR